TSLSPYAQRHVRFVRLDLDDGVFLVVPAGPLRDPEIPTANPNRTEWKHVANLVPIARRDRDREPERLERPLALPAEPAAAERDDRATAQSRIPIHPIGEFVLLRHC